LEYKTGSDSELVRLQFENPDRNHKVHLARLLRFYVHYPEQNCAEQLKANPERKVNFVDLKKILLFWFYILKSKNLVCKEMSSTAWLLLFVAQL
jgi:hypothetical protein